MKILFVCSKNSGKVAPFITEQANALITAGHDVVFFHIEGKGLLGYLKCYKPLKKKITESQPDIIHAHYGLSGLLANIQRKVPVVTTYHGSDINDPKVFIFSKLSILLSAYNIFVSKRTIDIVKPKRKFLLLPCGINVDEFSMIPKIRARNELDLDVYKKFTLFAGAFDNKVKNAELAIESVLLLKDIEIKECKGYTRQQMSLLMNAADALLMTSFTEGSPQVVKEAMACGCPIVSVDVGDVAEITEGVDGCYIAKTYDAKELADLLSTAIQFNDKTKGRERIIELNLDNKQIAKKLILIYHSILNK